MIAIRGNFTYSREHSFLCCPFALVVYVPAVIETMKDRQTKKQKNIECNGKLIIETKYEIHKHRMIFHTGQNMKLYLVVLILLSLSICMNIPYVANSV